MQATVLLQVIVVLTLTGSSSSIMRGEDCGAFVRWQRADCGRSWVYLKFNILVGRNRVSSLYCMQRVPPLTSMYLNYSTILAQRGEKTGRRRWTGSLLGWRSWCDVAAQQHTPPAAAAPARISMWVNDREWPQRKYYILTTARISIFLQRQSFFTVILNLIF